MNEQIIPAILALDEKDFAAKLSEIPKEIELIHIDVLEKDIWVETNIPFEVHIMSKGVEGVVELWASRGAKKIIVHSLSEKILVLKKCAEIGLAVELDEPLEKIIPLVPKVDFVHLMSIARIGEQGNPFDERIFDRIRSVKERFPGVVISLDGGIKTTNWEKVKNSGADRFIVGSGFKDLWNLLTKK